MGIFPESCIGGELVRGQLRPPNLLQIIHLIILYILYFSAYWNSHYFPSLSTFPSHYSFLISSAL